MNLYNLKLYLYLEVVSDDFLDLQSVQEVVRSLGLSLCDFAWLRFVSNKITKQVNRSGGSYRKFSSQRV